METDEKPVLLTRQHWYVFRDPSLVAFFVPFLALALTFFLDYSVLPFWLKDNLSLIFVWLAVGSFLFGLLFSLWRLYLWRRTFYLVTNRRLVLVTQYGLFHHQDRECSLSMIQDVKAEVKGMQASLYGFGDVIVQVSSEDARLVFEKVSYPHRVQHTIMKEAHLG